MAFLVRLSKRAERDLEAIYLYIRAQDSHAAHRWYQGLRKAILSLEELPKRCPLTPEDKRCRHLLYGRKPHIYRIIYRVLERAHRADILHIRHGARGAWKTR